MPLICSFRDHAVVALSSCCNQAITLITLSVTAPASSTDLWPTQLQINSAQLNFKRERSERAARHGVRVSDRLAAVRAARQQSEVCTCTHRIHTNPSNDARGSVRRRQNAPSLETGTPDAELRVAIRGAQSCERNRCLQKFGDTMWVEARSGSMLGASGAPMTHGQPCNAKRFGDHRAGRGRCGYRTSSRTSFTKGRFRYSLVSDRDECDT